MRRVLMLAFNLQVPLGTFAAESKCGSGAGKRQPDNFFALEAGVISLAQL